MWGIIAITQNGLALAKRLKVQFPESVIYSLSKWHDADCISIEPDLGTFTKTLFDSHKTLVYIMATGIVVRSIAHHLQSKTSDPAVIVLDEKGQHVISLLSGHLGGANAVATEIAKAINGQAVITTASDVQGLPSVDMIAKEHGLKIESMQDAKTITSMLVNGQKVSWQNECLVPILTNYDVLKNDSPEGLIIVSNKQKVNTELPFAQLIPVNIVVGVGCRRGVSGENIIAFINEQLLKNNINPKSIRKFASIDIKSDEQGIIETAQYFNVNVEFVAGSEIELIEKDFTASEFVKSQVGVSGVCEPAAFIAAGRNGQFISRKNSKEGITVAIFESAQ